MKLFFLTLITFWVGLANATEELILKIYPYDAQRDIIYTDGVVTIRIAEDDTAAVLLPRNGATTEYLVFPQINTLKRNSSRVKATGASGLKTDIPFVGITPAGTSSNPPGQLNLVPGGAWILNQTNLTGATYHIYRQGGWSNDDFYVQYRINNSRSVQQGVVVSQDEMAQQNTIIDNPGTAKIVKLTTPEEPKRNFRNREVSLQQFRNTRLGALDFELTIRTVIRAEMDPTSDEDRYVETKGCFITGMEHYLEGHVFLNGRVVSQDSLGVIWNSINYGEFKSNRVKAVFRQNDVLLPLYDDSKSLMENASDGSIIAFSVWFLDPHFNRGDMSQIDKWLFELPVLTFEECIDSADDFSHLNLPQPALVATTAVKDISESRPDDTTQAFQSPTESVSAEKDLSKMENPKLDE